MKKYRRYAIAALLAVPTIVVSGASPSTASLPEIDNAAKPYQQQNCPVEGGFGCFNSSGPSPVSFCSQFMQMFFRPAAR